MNSDPINQPLTEGESIFTDADLVPKLRNPHVRNARIVLYIFSGLICIGCIPEVLSEESGREKIFGLAVVFVMASIFFGLALWSRKRPFIAFLIATILYTLLFGSASIDQPDILRTAWYVLLPILALLILGVVYGKKMQDNMNLLKNR